MYKWKDDRNTYTYVGFCKNGVLSPEFATWKIVVLSVFSAISVLTIVLAVVVMKRSAEARWFFYKNSID